MDLGFHGSYLCRCLGDIVAKIAYIRRLASRFLSLSAFAASELGLLFSQLFLFVPIAKSGSPTTAHARCLVAT